MRTTLANAKASASGIARSINIAACDPRFTEFVNNAQQRLSEMGIWWGTYKRIYVCMTKSCVTWPREVANVEGFSLCQTGVDLLNEWYEFGESVSGPNTSTDRICGPPAVLERPNACQFTDIATSATIRIYPTVNADAGVKVLLQGLDGNRQPIRTEVDGAYVEGEQVTLAAPFATSTFEFLAPGLLGVQKPITKGRLNVFAVDPVSGDETKIAIWEASEVNPSYRRSFVANVPSCCIPDSCADTLNGCNPAPTPTCSNALAEAIVRLEFIPATVDTDWLFISNIQAIAAGCRALLAEERGDEMKAEIEWARGVKILRAELEKYSPKTLTRINAQPHGSAHPRRIFAGFV